MPMYEHGGSMRRRFRKKQKMKQDLASINMDSHVTVPHSFGQQQITSSYTRPSTLVRLLQSTHSKPAYFKPEPEKKPNLPATNISEASQLDDLLLRQRERTLRGSTGSRRIRRPLNCFMVFSHLERKRLSEENPDVHNADLSKILGSRWKQLSAAERQPYVDEAERMRQVHAKMYPEYKYQPRRRIQSKIGEDGRKSKCDASSSITSAPRGRAIETKLSRVSSSSVSNEPPMASVSNKTSCRHATIDLTHLPTWSTLKAHNKFPPLPNHHPRVIRPSVPRNEYSVTKSNSTPANVDAIVKLAAMVERRSRLVQEQARSESCADVLAQPIRNPNLFTSYLSPDASPDSNQRYESNYMHTSSHPVDPWAPNCLGPASVPMPATACQSRYQPLTPELSPAFPEDPRTSFFNFDQTSITNHLLQHKNATDLQTHAEMLDSQMMHNQKCPTHNLKCPTQNEYQSNSYDGSAFQGQTANRVHTGPHQIITNVHSRTQPLPNVVHQIESINDNATHRSEKTSTTIEGSTSDTSMSSMSRFSMCVSDSILDFEYGDDKTELDQYIDSGSLHKGWENDEKLELNFTNIVESMDECEQMLQLS